MGREFFTVCVNVNVNLYSASSQKAPLIALSNGASPRLLLATPVNNLAYVKERMITPHLTAASLNIPV